ncbi:MAG: glutamate dehydrogenase [Lutibacter sp.]|uniref:THC0290_0291 family protein n=1 Tax=Lutibacter sp. TaxID=1925666 RepID=UPI0018129C4D|nr:glutamate dehydrogenase [Lutibacter sp.]MBT8318352.1 glutamate dehydrogenase [Lutibacter sp.]NNJ59210.1 glutamate dehydrogenase [Lutibacter sp.]
MINYFKLFTFLLCCFALISVKGQDRSSHEIGFITGAASFTTDYGQRNNFNSNVGGNIGMGVGLIYYMNFSDYRYGWSQRTNYFNEHFRLRGELSFMTADLDHFGKWIDIIDNNTGELSLGAQQLRAMHGKTKLINFGAQLEFHIVDIVDFGSRRIPDLKWSPYASAGFMLDYYDPELKIDEPYSLFPKWNVDGATNMRSNITGSLTFGVGTRHKLGEYSDILIESRWQYFFSNFVDGLNARDDSANKYNDWLLWVHVGYVYYLN